MAFLTLIKLASFGNPRTRSQMQDNNNLKFDNCVFGDGSPPATFNIEPAEYNADRGCPLNCSQVDEMPICECTRGYIYDGTDCEACPPGFFCVDGVKTACPSGTTSAAGATGCGGLQCIYGGMCNTIANDDSGYHSGIAGTHYKATPTSKYNVTYLTCAPPDVSYGHFVGCACPRGTELQTVDNQERCVEILAGYCRSGIRLECELCRSIDGTLTRRYEREDPTATNCTIISERIRYLSPFAFRSLRNTERLLLSQNNLTKIPDNTFAGMGGLQRLDISSNKFLKLPDDAFVGLEYLSVLDISDTPTLGSLTADVFHGLSRLQILYLSSNTGLYTLPDGVFGELTGLQKLDVRENTNLKFDICAFGDNGAPPTLNTDVAEYNDTNVCPAPLVD